ncbi:uncharacterized protein ALTATR162_LOCUS7824 [Alternaria atra]|uniref:Tc1-like transposase DDE domain-containing protein n=1 Tax=Alternaria atra TaxID=119953 RepID=A0A8J2N7V5_9PLEO|nr:uncharacterized protein ALTATR162_LOCUS7824 [Alternaria atra]CAG5174620.1 unnamed protein product [Alternaria atra]
METQRQLISHATANAVQRRKTWRDIAKELGIDIGDVALNNLFHRHGYKRYRARKKPYHSEKQLRDRLNWAEERRNWTPEQWQRFVWSDESSFTMDWGLVYVTRTIDEGDLTDCMLPRFRKYSEWMVWGCIANGVKGPLVFVERDWGKAKKGKKKGTIDGAAMRKHIVPKILEMKEFMETFIIPKETIIFMEDGAGAHRSRETHELYAKKSIHRDNHPANSPDLNPIEPIWLYL